MNVTNVRNADDWFSVLQTSRKTQTAIMTLSPGQSSGDEKEAHDASEQVLLVLEGEVFAEIGDETKILHARDIVLIPAGVPHRFTNKGEANCVTFNTYSPPEY